MTGGPPNLTEQEVLAELERVLATPDFRKNPTARQFLGFIVRETLAGRGDRLKAFTIATLALQRDASFDPQQNSIVRVHATRLRQLLEACNAAAEANQTVRILLPRGSYQPAFERINSPYEITATTLSKSMTSPASIQAWRVVLARTLRQPALYAVIGVITAVVFAATWIGLGQREPSTASSANAGRPRISVQAQMPDGTSAPPLRMLVSSVENAISAFDHVMVTISDRSPTNSDYQLILANLGAHENQTSGLTARLIRQKDGGILWTRQFDVPLPDTPAAISALTRTIVLQIADTNGALARDIERRISSGELGNANLKCELTAIGSFYKRDTESHQSARNCLARSLAAENDDAGLLALQAIVLVRGYLDALPGNRGLADLQAGLQSARAAYERMPFKARTRFALFLARFYDHRYDDAFNAASQALLANPNSILISSSIGSAYITRGKYAEGIALLDPPRDPEIQVHRPFASYLALAALMTGDMDTHWKWAARTSTINSPLGVLMRAIGCRYRGDQGCADAMTVELQQRFPGFAADVPAALQRYAFTDEIRNRLLNELGKSTSAQPRPN